jgi:ComF family protein
MAMIKIHPMNYWLNRFFYTLLPGTCMICKASTHRLLDLCAGCQRSLPYNRHACWQCGLQMMRGIDICAACLSKPPNYSHCFSLLNYQPPVDTLMSQFKNHNRLVVGRVLAILLARAYRRRHLLAPDYWIPVPLHKTAARLRGFNQATEIAQILAEFTGVPTLPKAARRIAHGTPQKQLNAEDRIENIKGAFEVDIDLTGLAIGIVDDVVTTGATVSELTNQLLDAGAADIQIVCLARTPEN